MSHDHEDDLKSSPFDAIYALLVFGLALLGFAIAVIAA